MRCRILLTTILKPALSTGHRGELADDLFSVPPGLDQGDDHGQPAVGAAESADHWRQCLLVYFICGSPVLSC